MFQRPACITAAHHTNRRMRFYNTLLLLVLTCAAFEAKPAGNDSPTPETILLHLDDVLARRGEYRTARLAQSDSLRADLMSTSDTLQRILKAERMGYRYVFENTDSAIHYFAYGRDLARQRGNTSLALRLDAHRISMLAFKGDLLAATQSFNAIDTTLIEPADRGEFYSAGSRIYLSVASFENPAETSALKDSGSQTAMRYLRYTPVDTPPYNFVAGILAYLSGRKARGLSLLSDVVEVSAPENVYRAWAEELIGYIRLTEGKHDDAIIHLANALILDVENGIPVGNSIRLLSRALMEQGDYKRADHLLNIAMLSAEESGDKMHFEKAAQLTPEVAEGYRQQANRANTIIIILSVALAIALAAIGWLLYRSRRENAQLRKSNERVKKTDMLRVKYFNTFLSMCAMYIERLEDFKKLTHRKIKAGQTDELLKMISNGDVLEQQTDKFYSIFDSAFTHAYPTFIKEVNMLLQPDKQLDTPPAGSLSTDFRLLAFMRLGYDDSAQIGKFMGFSVNTIYTYRNRLRSRAIDRDTFEDAVRNIAM